MSNLVIDGARVSQPALRPLSTQTKWLNGAVTGHASVHAPSVRPAAAEGDGAFDLVLKGAIVLTMVGVLAAATWTEVLPTFVPIWTHTVLGRVFAVLGGLTLVHFGVSIVHALVYRPVPTPSDAELPTVTVIVPAYNEGEMVRVALRSALHSNYPKNKLHVVAVDDGSKDDTWHHMQAVAAAFPGRITAIKQPKNGGKRAALRRGFDEVQSDIVVTVDSDSRLDPDALRNLVAPFVHPEIGAVAGKVLVLNRFANILTRMMAARFFVTFDLLRAAQARYGAVLCTPGALSAYRMSAVRPVMDAWAGQTFMGAPCTIAEDRALATWLLKNGWRSSYQSTSTVRTLMPTEWSRMVRMLLRWERGNVREHVVLLPHLATLWSRRPSEASAPVAGQAVYRGIDRWWPALEVIIDLASPVLGVVSVALLATQLAVAPVIILRVLSALVVFSLIQSLYSLRTERRTDFVYGVAYVLMYFFALQWVGPYSALTVRNGRWLTR